MKPFRFCFFVAAVSVAAAVVLPQQSRVFAHAGRPKPFTHLGIAFRMLVSANMQTGETGRSKATEDKFLNATVQSSARGTKEEIALPFLPVEQLFLAHPGAVSIALRFSKATDFADATRFYRTALALAGSLSGKDSIVTDGTSESYRVTRGSSKAELLIAFQNKANTKTDCTIAYKPLDASIDDTVKMNKAFKALIKSGNGKFKAIEEPKASLRGSRDDKKSKKAFRAVYQTVVVSPSKSSKKMFASSPIMRILEGEEFDGIIINPPIP